MLNTIEKPVFFFYLLQTSAKFKFNIYSRIRNLFSWYLLTSDNKIAKTYTKKFACGEWKNW